MTSAALGQATVGRDPFMPERPPGMRTGLAMALLAHALLIAGLAYSVDWHAATPEAVEAELWSAVPQQAAPRAMAPEPSPAPAPAPRETVAPVPAPRPQPAPPLEPPRPDPQIAIEKVREAKRIQAQEAQAGQEQARRDKARRDERDRQQQAREAQAQKKLLADRQEAASASRQKLDKQKANKESAEKAKADQANAAQLADARAKAIKRMQGLAGASGEEKSTGNAMKSSGPSASYGGRIVARIKPNIVFPDAVDGNPAATVEVKVAPDGTIIGRRLKQSSGVKAWDDAVLRAIDRTDGLPRDIDGRVPSVLDIEFKPRDL